MSPSISNPHFRSWIAVAFALFASARVVAADADSSLTDLSVEELMKVEVTALSKRPQTAAHAAAAVFVISQDDIRRSGATTIPEALRLAPGITVAQIDAGTWAIGARGDTGRFANKLLVLMDGRTLYAPTYGGVYWDVQDTLIEDIERIEVILGPGGAIWGANAVNGVISIVTKNASQTLGLLASADSDFDGRQTLGVRYGGSIDESLDWRAYARHLERGPNELSDGARAFDGLDQNRVGARADWRITPRHSLTGWLEAYEGDSHHTEFPLVLMRANLPRVPRIEEVDGISARIAGDSTLNSEWRAQWQLTYDHFDRWGALYNEVRDTLELGAEFVAPRFGSHETMWGVSGRHSEDRITRGSRALALPIEGDTSLLSAFVQDTVYLFDDRAAITFGTKYEQDDATGSSFMPSLRARYALGDSHTVWGAVSRGTRSPSRGERTLHLTTSAAGTPLDLGQDDYPVPVLIHAHGNPHLRDEEVTAYEIGTRSSWGGSLSIDISGFFNRYDDLRGTAVLEPGCRLHDTTITMDADCLANLTYIVLPVLLVNSGSSETRGGEARLTWRPLPTWRLFASYSYLEQDTAGRTSPDFLSGFDPKHSALLRSILSIDSHWDWDATVRYVDPIKLLRIPSYVEVSTRVAWRPRMDVEVALVGNNLLHDAHPEFLSELADMPQLSIGRNIALQLRWTVR